MSQPPIFTRVEQDLAAARQQWDAFRDHWPHRHYHDPQPAATPATEAPMSVSATIKADYEDVLAKLKEFGETKIPAALGDVQKLEGNPVVDALLSAVHVPSEALTMAVTVINQLEELYKPETDSPAPVVASDPAMGSAPEAAPEPLPVAS